MRCGTIAGGDPVQSTTLLQLSILNCHSVVAEPIDPEPYRAYSHRMGKARHKGAEEARNQLPSLVEDAAKGRTTIITRRGRSIAALVPIDDLSARPRQKGLLDLIGSGKGLWDRSSRPRRLRDEWNR
jgi:prevent-host-death family protein